MSEHTPTPLPCPFCGAAARAERHGDLFTVWCPNDDCHFNPALAIDRDPYGDSMAEAIARWNTRHAPDLLAALDTIANRRFLVDDDDDERNQMVTVATAAIAAARGDGV